MFLSKVALTDCSAELTGFFVFRIQKELSSASPCAAARNLSLCNIMCSTNDCTAGLQSFRRVEGINSVSKKQWCSTSSRLIGVSCGNSCQNLNKQRSSPITDAINGQYTFTEVTAKEVGCEWMECYRFGCQMCSQPGLKSLSPALIAATRAGAPEPNESVSLRLSAHLRPTVRAD